MGTFPVPVEYDALPTPFLRHPNRKR